MRIKRRKNEREILKLKYGANDENVTTQKKCLYISKFFERSNKARMRDEK